MTDEIRIGKVSSVDSATGMVEVTYEDRDSVTDMFPYLSLNGEYKPPDIGSNVLVAHLSNGSCAGIVVGTYWNESNRPQETGKIYRKDISKNPGEAYIRYDEESGELVIKAKKVTLEQG